VREVKNEWPGELGRENEWPGELEKKIHPNAQNRSANNFIFWTYYTHKSPHIIFQQGLIAEAFG
jgi:hypothetical protein